MSMQNREPDSPRGSGLAIALIVGSLLLFWLVEMAIFSARRTEAPGPVSVESAVAFDKTQSTISEDGTVDWLPAVTVSAPIDGRIRKVRFENGERVQRGQPLFTLTASATAISQDKRALSRDDARLAAARVRGLSDMSLRVRTDANAIEAGMAQLESDRFESTGVTVVAPTDGLITAPLVRVGDQVHAGWHLANINPSAQRVSFTVSGSVAGLLKSGSVVSITNDAGVHALARVENAGDQNAENSVALRADVLGDEPGLLPGAAVRVGISIPTGRKFVAVPSEAIAARNSGPSVYVIGNDGTIEVRGVNVASIEGDTALIEDGLAAGERVVRNGGPQLAAGTRVKIENPPWT